MAKGNRGGPRRIRIHDIKEGGQAFEFEVGEEELSEYLKAVDEAYESRGMGLKVALVLTRVNDNVFMKGNISTELSFTCSRCLQKMTRSLEIPLRWTFLPVEGYRAIPHAGDEEVELESDDLDVSFYEGETISLRDVVREAVDLELPPYPACETPCVGVWEQTDGASSSGLDELDGVDPRWLGLKKLADKQDT